MNAKHFFQKPCEIIKKMKPTTVHFQNIVVLYIIVESWSGISSYTVNTVALVSVTVF